MNRFSENEDDEVEGERASRSRDREITLGTTMILLIFFSLAVYSAAVFGFGYSLGSKHSGGATIAAAPSGITYNTFKPSPGSTTGAPGAKPPVVDTTPVPTTPIPAVVKTVPLPEKTAGASDGEDSAAKGGVRTAPSASAASFPTPPATAGPAMVVQVAAVSHQEDADLIATTLERRGYTVTVRSEPDKLLHVQVGPFTNRKDAEAMRQKLLNDGFNAYIK